MDELDLTVHQFEEVPGKVVVLNGARYVCQDSIGDEEDSRVYPLKNLKSGLVLFVAKVLEEKPGTRDYESSRSSFYDAIRSLEATSRSAIGAAELYETYGGLIRLQRVPVDPTDNPADESARMERARRLSEQKKPLEASRVYDEILERNPHHTNALANKAICVWRLNDSAAAALELVLAAIRIEPNDRRLYHLAADCFVAQGKFLEAALICRKTPSASRMNGSRSHP